MRYLLLLLLALPTTIQQDAATALLRSNQVYESQMVAHQECHGSKEYKPTSFCQTLNAIPAAQRQVRRSLAAYKKDPTTKDKLAASIARLTRLTAAGAKGK